MPQVQVTHVSLTTPAAQLETDLLSQPKVQRGRQARKAKKGETSDSTKGAAKEVRRRERSGRKEREAALLLEEELGKSGESSNSEDSILMYLREIRAYDLLTAEQETNLAEQIAQGDQEASKRFVEANLRLVVSIARRYINQGVSLSDLIQEGNLGLMHALRKFDHERGYRFSTYATWWIRQYLSRAVAEGPRTIHVPVHVVELLHKMKRITQQLCIELCRDPFPDEIARAMKLSTEVVVELQNTAEASISLDVPLIEDEQYTLADILEDSQAVNPDDAVRQSVLRDLLTQALDTLDDPRERRIIELRFGLLDEICRTHEELAVLFKLSRERIRQIEQKALRSLRRKLQAHLPVIEQM